MFGFFDFSLVWVAFLGGSAFTMPWGGGEGLFRNTFTYSTAIRLRWAHDLPTGEQIDFATPTFFIIPSPKCQKGIWASQTFPDLQEIPTNQA